MADITQNIDPVGQYGGTIPDRATQTAEQFANNVYPFQLYWNSVFIPNTVTLSSQISSWNTQANNLKDEINTLRNTVVNKEALMNPHYTAMDTIENNIAAINAVNDNKDNINAVADNKDNVDTNALNITAINTNAENITDIQNANSSAVEATQQAAIATDKANEAANSAIDASNNAAIATQKAQEAADTVANIEDDRIMVETKAAEVASNTDTVLATASIDFASFTLEDGELNIGYFDPTASTPSIVDGEFIITY